MLSISEKYKGIHPGVVLDRELKKRAIKQRPFALSIGEHPQIFNAIINATNSQCITTGIHFFSAKK